MIIVQLYTISPSPYLLNYVRTIDKEPNQMYTPLTESEKKERDYILYIVSFLFIYNKYYLYIRVFVCVNSI